jgi:ABC-type transport system involved in cytochrome c biogenesis permease subunit
MNINLVTWFGLLAIAWGTLETGSNLLALAQGADAPLRHVSRLVLPLLWLAGGIGIYRRKEQGRKLVVVLLALSAVINVVLAVYSIYMVTMALRTTGDWAELEQTVQPVRTAAVAAGVASLLGAVICGWLFRRFQSADIRREFA